MNYIELKKQQESEFNNFPMGFAFSEKQLEEVANKIAEGKKENLLSIGYGGLISKKDKDAFIALNKKLKIEKENFLADEKNLKDAIIYEMGDHEYCFDENDDAILGALGISEKRANDKDFQTIYEKAKKAYFKKAEKNW